jgi:hypothetical protein
LEDSVHQAGRESGHADADIREALPSVEHQFVDLGSRGNRLGRAEEFVEAIHDEGGVADGGRA